MKKLTAALSILVVAAIAMIGCGKSAADRVQSSFASAEPAVKESANKAATAAQAGNFGEAMGHLQTLVSKANTPEQQQAVKDLLTEVGEKLKAEAGKAVEGAQKALGDLGKTLKK